AMLAPIGLIVGSANLRYARRAPAERMAHWYEHMGAMIGAGVAFHTAFAVFGGARVLGLGGLEGPWAFVPWILPAAIGLPATALWTRYYRRKFAPGGRDAGPRGGMLGRQDGPGSRPGLPPSIDPSERRNSSRVG